jgi:hypothetical protein
MKIQSKLYLITLVLFLANTNQTPAQDSIAAKKKWQWFVQPYMMFPVMDGTMGLGELPDAEIHSDASDIFSHLQFGAMLYAEASNGRWAITNDLIYMDLGEDIAGEHGILSGTAGAKQFVWELAGLRKLNPWLEAGIGMRLYSLSAELDMQVNATVPGGSGPRHRSTSETWVDPIIIGRVKFPAGTKWLLQLRGDLGGFGIGSEFTWQAQGDIAYRFSKLFQLGLGYRYIGVDFEKGSGTDRFLYDIDTYGPVLRFGFHF